MTVSRIPINFRAFAVVAVCVLLSILSAYLYALCKPAGICLFCVLVCALIVALVIFIKLYLFKRTKLRYAITFALSLALVLCAFVCATVSYENWRNGFSSGDYTVQGRVCGVDTRNGSYRLVLEDVKLDGKSADGLMRVDVAVSDNNLAEIVGCGDRLTFYSNVYCMRLFDGETIDGSAYRNDTRYYSSVLQDAFVISYGSPTAMEVFTTALRELYEKNMGKKYGNIAFSMLTGDKYGLDSDVFEYFSAAGIGHIMAVSGLHIGFLTLFLNLILCKIHKKLRFPIIGAILFAYAFLADFSPSVVRAVIMAYISGAAILVNGRRDLLSSLLCAFSLMLAFKPWYLFDVGFMLSFGAMFGIAMFADQFGRIFKRFETGRKLGNLVGGSAAVSLGILPAQIYYFGSVQVFAIIINTVLLPYISVIFILAICCTAIAAIPGCGPLLSLCKWALVPLDYIAYGISAIPFSTMPFRAASGVFACYPVMFCASRYFMAGKIKPIIAVYSVVICILIAIFCMI